MSKQDASDVCVVEDQKEGCEIDFNLCCSGLLPTIDTLMFQLNEGVCTDERSLASFANDIHESLGAIKNVVFDKPPTSEREARRFLLYRRLLEVCDEQNPLMNLMGDIEMRRLILSKPAPSDAQPAADTEDGGATT